jgi:hypothetical protein
VSKNIYNIDEVIETISSSINKMGENDFINKADLQINDNISIKSNGAELLKSGDKVEVKKMNYNADSYFSEFFAIYKNPDKLPKETKTPEFIEIYKKIINGVYNKVKNNKNILNFIKKGLKGIMFDDYIFVKMEDIELYWSTAGARNCNIEPRLSIRYRVVPKNKKTLTLYYYDPSHSDDMPSKTIENFTPKPEKKC